MRDDCSYAELKTEVIELVDLASRQHATLQEQRAMIKELTTQIRELRAEHARIRELVLQHRLLATLLVEPAADAPLN
jgi:hypothetical protein